MARFDRLTVFQTLLSSGLLPLFYHPGAEVSLHTARALARGGAHLLEYTNRGIGAVTVFQALEERLADEHPQLILGAGTVEDAPTAAMYIMFGASFIVGPSFNADVARVCNRHKIAYIPGVATVTEIATAEEYGAEVVKLFPGETTGGPDFVRAVVAARPWTRIMPSGGVSPDPANLRAWFSAGAAAVCLGAKFISNDWLNAGNYAAIESLTRETVDEMRRLRGS